MTYRYLSKETVLFNSTLKALASYNRLAYKNIIFNIIPSLRVTKKKHKENVELEYYVQCSDKFEMVHGKVIIIYTVSNNLVTLERIEPCEVLVALHSKQYATYKGVPILSDKDKFKIDLYEKIYPDK